MNSNNKRRSQDISDWSKETELCEKLFAKGRNCNRNDIQQGKEMDEPTKLSWPLNQPSAKAADYHPAFYEKRSDLNNDGLKEARRDPGLPDSRSRYFFQTSWSKKRVCACSDISIGDALVTRSISYTLTNRTSKDLSNILAFDSRQVDPKTEVSGRCKGLSSGKEKSLDGSGSVNKCSDCEEPKEKTPEVDRTRLFNYSERAEETSSSVEISTVLKGYQDSYKSLIHSGR